jgi:hypothetical protein
MRPDWEAQELAREAFEKRRQRKTWLIAFGVVPVVVTLALVATGLLRLEGAGRYAEGQEVLERVARAQQVHREKTGRWATRFADLGVTAPEFFTCFLSEDERLTPTSADATEVRASELPRVVDELALGVTCEAPAPCDYLAACAARWEWNGLMTVWFVSSRAHPDTGRKAHVPFSPGAVP